MTYKPEGYRIAGTENHEFLSSLAGLERAQEKGKILESTALLCDGDFTLHFDLFGVHGIMPRTEVQHNEGGEETKDIAILTRVGKPTCFKVVGFRRDERGNICAILSRKAAQAECRYAFIDTLAPGDVLAAKVTHLEPFGAFVDVGCGIISLLSIDAISVSRIAHPRDRFSPGDRIFVAVKSIDGTGRIYVTQRELLGTWEENAALFSVGQTVAGVVRSIESYGIFIELAPNLAGLAERKDGIEVGSHAAVYIKNILPEKMKVKLVIIDTHAGGGEKIPLHYFIDPKSTAHLSYWRYSPACAKKLVETKFDN
ncbi:MAG: 30S ribosomal protein S1 [Clostridia bacterium]|nr:30S ribosomal protein S1 [Clostridia bacterium]